MEAFWQFNKAIIDATYDLIPAVKPQIAMYEQFGVEGIACYIKTIAYAKEMGLLVIGDIKRSDIASTAEAYANGLGFHRTLFATLQRFSKRFVYISKNF